MTVSPLHPQFSLQDNVKRHKAEAQLVGWMVRRKQRFEGVTGDVVVLLPRLSTILVHLKERKEGVSRGPICCRWLGEKPLNAKACRRPRTSSWAGLAIGETFILLHPPLPLVGVFIWMERGCQ